MQQHLVFNQPKTACVTPLLIDLYWLPLAAPLKFKLPPSTWFLSFRIISVLFNYNLQMHHYHSYCHCEAGNLNPNSFPVCSLGDEANYWAQFEGTLLRVPTHRTCSLSFSLSFSPPPSLYQLSLFLSQEKISFSFVIHLVILLLDLLRLRLYVICTSL